MKFSVTPVASFKEHAQIRFPSESHNSAYEVFSKDNPDPLVSAETITLLRRFSAVVDANRVFGRYALIDEIRIFFGA